ncbi:MAG: hypothetical protein ACREHG_03430 [Candidatus Saccharimonadales bacterium]
MQRELPANLDEILQPRGDYFLDELYATVAVHGLRRLGERSPSRLSPTMITRRDFIQGYLSRLVEVGRDPMTQGFDDRDMLRQVYKIDSGATLTAYRTADRVYPLY